MNFSSLWAFLASFYLVTAAGILEIDVVFPLANHTYAPSNLFPIIFAIQNSRLASPLRPSIDSFIRNGSTLGDTFGHSSRDLTYANFSSDPFFVYHWVRIDTEGRHLLFATARWLSCDLTGEEVEFLGNSTNFGVPFMVKAGGEVVDLIAATNNEDGKCEADGVAISVTDETREVAPSLNGKPSGTCAVVEPGTTTLTPSPCRVKIYDEVVASMDAVLQDKLCRGINPPENCPKKSEAERVLVAGIVSLVAMVGVVGYIFA